MHDRVSISQAARLAGVDRRTIQRWIAAGKLSYRDRLIEGRYSRLVSLAHVRELVDEITTGRPPREPRG